MNNTGCQLRGKRALSAGGRSGIRAAPYELLLEQGAPVVSHSISECGGFVQRNSIQPRVDLGERDPVRDAATWVFCEGDFDILLNDTGQVIHRPHNEVSDDYFDGLMNLDVRFSIVLAQAVVPCIKQRGSGRIVKCASRAIVGLATSPGLLSTSMLDRALPAGSPHRQALAESIPCIG